MKTILFTSKCLAVAVAVLGSQFIGAATVCAQDLYPISFSAVGISTNAEGHLVYKSLDNRSLIQETAEAQGITNLTGLSLVYSVEGNDVEVVSGTNKTVIGTPLTFSGGVSLTNASGTEGQLLEYVDWDTNSEASGTLVAGELFHYNPTSKITDVTLQGQLQLGLPDNGTNGPAIYLGNIFVHYRQTPVVIVNSVVR
ncbi:MAG: hypothetical protein ABSE48_16585 [Verrucomicrobiota bacterium]